MKVTPESKNLLVVISPVRNEADYIEKIIESMVAQTVKPVEWLIVDDGSTDGTSEILDQAAAQHDWIHVEHRTDRGFRSVGPGVVEAFYYGYERIRTPDYNFICKMDGDLELKPKYFQTLLDIFSQNPHLGGASGKSYLLEEGNLILERSNDEIVAGQVNCFRRQCFEDIGGYVREVHWDGICSHRARMEGWGTRSIDHPDLMFVHQRLMGSSEKGILNGRLRWGRGQYFMGTHPLYILAICLYRLFEKPFFLGGICILLGYYKAMLEGMPRYENLEFRKSLNAWQLERIKLGRRLENIPSCQNGLLQS